MKTIGIIGAMTMEIDGIKSAMTDVSVKKTGGMEFASELLVEFAKHKFKIEEVNISLKKGVKGRKSHLNTWKDGWRHLCYIIGERFV